MNKIDIGHAPDAGIRRPMRGWLQVCLALVVLAIAGAGWIWRDALLANDASPSARASGGRPAPVNLAMVQTGVVVRAVEAVGTVNANEAIDVTPKETGTISAMGFVEGETVEAGRVLVELDSRETQAELQAARAVAENARSLFERTRALLRQQSAAQARFDEVASALKVADARVKVAEAQLADLRVVAPFRGKVGLKRVSIGALVTPGTVITTLDDVASVKLDFALPEIALSRLHPGLQVEARSDAYPERRFIGTVQTIDSRVDPSTRAVNVRATLPNSDGALKPGMFLTVNLIIERRENALLIPEEALVPVGERQYVFQVENGKAVRREVTLGQRTKGEVEILSGLEADGQVIVGGIQKIREGSAVVPTRAADDVRGAIPRDGGSRSGAGT